MTDSFCLHCMSQLLSCVAAWHCVCKQHVSVAQGQHQAGVGVDAALPVKSHFWIGRVHPHCAGLTEWWILDLKAQVWQKCLTSELQCVKWHLSSHYVCFWWENNCFAKILLTALCPFYAHISPHFVLWSFICSAYVLYSVWHPGCQLFRKETAHADQHSAHWDPVWPVDSECIYTHTPDLEARWEKDIINSARDDMYILN